MEIAISPALRAMMDASPDLWGCSDRQSVFLYANRPNARLAGFPDHLDVIGRTVRDFPCDVAQCADLFDRQGDEVMSTGLPLRTLDIHPFADDAWHAFVCTRTPLRNGSGDIAGIIFHGVEISSANMLELGRVLTSIVQDDTGAAKLVNATSYIIDRRHADPALTRRESEVLFLMLRCCSTRGIAGALHLSPRTVEQYMAQLRDKFAAGSKNELIDLAIQRGYLNYIPQSLFTRQLSVILRDRENRDGNSH